MLKKLKQEILVNKVLVVVDFQNDFITGTLGFEDAITLINPITNFINEKRVFGYDIIYLYDTHDDNYLNTDEGTHLPVLHCIKGTEGFLYEENVGKTIKPGDKIIEKPTFGSLELGNYLKEKGYSEVILIGLVTNMCILSNALISKAALPNAKIIVKKDLVKSFSSKLHDDTLSILESAHIVIE
jgi:nicotinamidase-related amidase